MYSIQTDRDGEVATAKTLTAAKQLAKLISKHNDAAYITKIEGGDAGDVTIAEYQNGKAVN